VKAACSSEGERLTASANVNFFAAEADQRAGILCRLVNARTKAQGCMDPRSAAGSTRRIWC
jgi:hypothetical protein